MRRGAWPADPQPTTSLEERWHRQGSMRFTSMQVTFQADSWAATAQENHELFVPREHQGNPDPEVRRCAALATIFRECAREPWRLQQQHRPGIDQNREPLWRCPHCSEVRFTVIGAMGSTQHLRDVHGIHDQPLQLDRAEIQE